MIYPAPHTILSLLEKGIAVPCMQSIGFYHDPFHILLSLKNMPGAFILESSMQSHATGRYSFIGAEPRSTLIIDAPRTPQENCFAMTLKSNFFKKRRRKSSESSLYFPMRQEFPSHFFPKKDRCLYLPKDDIPNIHRLSRTDPCLHTHLRTWLFPCPVYHDKKLPPFTGGAVGYLAYSAATLFDTIPLNAPNDLEIPDMYLMWFDTVIVYDHQEKNSYILHLLFPGACAKKILKQGLAKIDAYIYQIKSRATHFTPFSSSCKRRSPLRLLPEMTESTYAAMVRKAKEYIKAGDIYQANLSQRLSSKVIDLDAYALYCSLKTINPSGFGGFLQTKDMTLISSSPERLVSLSGDIAQTRPIAGTVPRGINPTHDTIWKRRLLLSPKQRAEHLMLVDLERNDLGKVCTYGSVYVNALMELESYSHVSHIVSNIRGTLTSSHDALDLLSAMFPGGTITGVPKIRCMQIIDELEPVGRNIYTGSMGYIGANGNMDMNILIRTFVLKNNRLFLQTGAGIVADSHPHREYQETLDKAEALKEALKRMPHYKSANEAPRASPRYLCLPP